MPTQTRPHGLTDDDLGTILVLTRQAVDEAYNGMSAAGRAWVLDRADSALEVAAGSGVMPQLHAGLRRSIRAMRRELDHESEA